MRKKDQPRKFDTWQVIYMDLMTIIMVFFVILWSINQGRDVGVSETVGDESRNIVNLPGDVLFKPGKAELSGEGKSVLKKLFLDETGQILNFETSGLVKRLLVIHGHTDSDGRKEKNLQLGYERAYRAYEEIRRYGKELSDHVILCTHADNSPETEIPAFAGRLTPAQRQTLRQAKSKNRRITIEDKIVDVFGAD